MKKRILAFLLASAMAVSMAACKDSSSSGGSTTAAGGNSTTAAGGGDSTTAAGASGKIPITFYTFTEETGSDLLPFVYRQNPGFEDKYDVQVVLEADAETYIKKVESALASGSGIDIYVADADYARKFASNPKAANVKDYIDFNEADYYTYVLDMMRVGGNVKALTHQATPGVMYYRSDLAKEIGYDTPDALQAKVGTWEGYLQVADQLKAKGVYMNYGTDELKRTFLNGRQSGWVVDGNLNIDEDLMKKFFQTTKALYDNDELSFRGTGQWSAGWQAGARAAAWDEELEDGTIVNHPAATVFSYFGSTWYLHYCLKGWTVTEGVYDTNEGQLKHAVITGEKTTQQVDQEIADSNNGTFGDWGMVAGPQGYFWGGTYWFAPTFLVEDAGKADVLEGVKTIIETMCVRDDSVEAYAKEFGDFISKKTVVEKIKNDPLFDNPFLGGQNHYVIFAEAAPKVDASKNVTIYDAQFDTFVNNAINEFFTQVDAGKDFDSAYKAAMKSFVDSAGTICNAEAYAGKFD